MKNKLAHITNLIVLVLASTALGQVIPTNTWMDFHGTVTFNGAPAPVGTIVNAFDPDGVWCGTFTVGDNVDSAGIYGFMSVYGDDSFSPAIDEGAVDGDLISFKVNGRDAIIESGDATWIDKFFPSPEVNLSASGNVSFMLLDFENIKEGAPFDTVRFNLQVKNIGDGTDFYGVSSNSLYGWTTIDVAAPAYAEPGDTAQLYFDVVVPAFDTIIVDTISFTVFSHLDTTVIMNYAFVILSHTPDSNFSFFVNSYPNDASAAPGDTIRFEIGITNDGNFYDDFYGVSSISGSGWTTINSQLVPVSGSSSGIVYFDVVVPQSITTLVDTITYTVFSHLSPLSYDSSVIITIPLGSGTHMTVVDTPNDTSGREGSTVRFTLMVLNDSTTLDIYGITSSTASGWTTIDTDSTFNTPGNTTDVYFDVVIPTDAGNSVETISYTVSSLIDSSQHYSGTVMLTSFLDTVVNLSIVLPATDKSGRDSDTVHFIVGVYNSGNVTDTYTISLISMTDNSWPFIAGSNVSNLVGDTAFISFSVAIPDTAPALVNMISYTVTSTVDPSVSDGATVNLSTITTDVDERQLAGLPDKFAVGQNYPNPFNPVTSIEYALPGKSDVTLEVYNLLGQQVERVGFGVKAAGNYHLEFDGSRLASGVYFYRIVTEFGAETRKMVLLK